MDSWDFPKTAERRDALWKMYDSNVSQSQHHEKQRARVVRVLFTINVALIGLITFDGSIKGIGDAVVAAFLLATGMFGAAFTFKTYERSQYHFQRARAFRDRIDSDYFSGEIARLQREADRVHDQDFRWIRVAKLHRWWIAMNLTVAMIACLLIVVTAFYPISA